MATQPVIEEYAKNNRNKGLSIFDRDILEFTDINIKIICVEGLSIL
jgi:hypothetical protein